MGLAYRTVAWSICDLLFTSLQLLVERNVTSKLCKFTNEHLIRGDKLAYPLSST